VMSARRSPRGADGPRALHSFPTRRSSDLAPLLRLDLHPDGPGLPARGADRLPVLAGQGGLRGRSGEGRRGPGPAPRRALTAAGLDRKSTRLNSSHVKISYAVSRLKTKTLP